MKLKDIKVGVAYAIAAPNGYDAKHPRKGTVTKVGVHGASRNLSYRRSKSKRANYVEFTEKGPAYGSYQTTIEVATGEVPDGVFGRSKGDTTQVLRAQSSHVLMTWADHLKELAEKKARHEEATKREDAEEAADEKLAKALEKHGVSIGVPFGISSKFSIYREEVQKLVDLLEGKGKS